MAKLAKKAKILEQKSTAFFDMSEDFIPYACHFDESTILTKNLQLLQTIKINSFIDKDSHEGEFETLKEHLRDAVAQRIKSDEFALWIHTIRRETDVSGWVAPKDEFGLLINKTWSSANNLQKQLVNELYLTVIISSVKVENRDLVLKHFTAGKFKKFIDSGLEQKHEELNEACDAIIADLAMYTPRKLGVEERNGALFSENMEFFHRLINLGDMQFPLEEADISSELCISQISLGLNRCEVQNNFKRSSVAILTLKHFLDVSPDVLDLILHLPIEFTVFQAFDFIDSARIKDKFELQHKMLLASKDEHMMKWLGISEDLFSEDEEAPTPQKSIKYGESQICIRVYGENNDDLEAKTSKLVETLGKIGFVTVREDVMMEDALYACLPGNFLFLRRMQPIKTELIGGFSSIDNYPLGRIHGSIWGDALCAFQTRENIPYFFNFHDDTKIGHTVVLGTFGDLQKNAIVNFLLSQSFKYEAKILAIDSSASTRAFGAIIPGSTVQSFDANTLRLNPFALKTEKNEGAFLAFLETFITSIMQLSGKHTKHNTEYLKTKLIPFLKAHLKDIDDIPSMLEVVKSQKVIDTFFGAIKGGGAIREVFLTKQDSLTGDFKFLTLQTSGLISNLPALGLLTRYFMEALKLLAATPGLKRTIVRFEDFFTICKMVGISWAEIADFFESIKSPDLVLIVVDTYTCLEEGDLAFAEQGKRISNISGTQIYTPLFATSGEKPIEATFGLIEQWCKFFGISEKGKADLASIMFNEHEVAIKHGGKCITAKFEPASFGSLYFALANYGIAEEHLKNVRAATTLPEKQAEYEALYNKLIKG